MKNNKTPEFYVISAKKTIKMPEFFYDICLKNTQILNANFPKKYFPDLLFFRKISI